MEDATNSAKKLSARKKPTQERSQQTVNRILDSARTLLKKTGGSGSSRMTTHHIAKEAGISVGSLYQYFPNMDAIVFEVYREVLETVPSIMDRFDSAEYLALPKEEFFEKLNRELTKAEPDTDLVLAMLHVSKTYPMLIEAEREHAERTAKRLAGFLKHYGSQWSIAKLERLALYLFYLDHGSWMYRDHVKPNRQEVLEWERGALNFLLQQCFN